MKRVLLIVPWDPVDGHNARSENLMRLFASAGHEAILLHRKTHRSHAFPDLIRNSLSFSVAVSRSGNGTAVAVDPFLNYAPGIRFRTEIEPGDDWRFWIKRSLLQILSPLGSLRDISCLMSFWFYALQFQGRFDWCLGFDAGGALVSWLLQKFGKVRMFIYEDQDYGPMGGYLRRKITAWLEKFLVRRADLVISVGFRLSALRRTQTSNPCHVVHNGAPLRIFEASRQKSASPPTLVFSGNILPWDGLDVVISALPLIRARVGPVRLVVVGDGPPLLMQRLRRMVMKEDVVQFLGPRRHEELPTIFSQAHIGLAFFQPAPFRIFSFPLKVIEYMTSGMPVIATENTEAGDLVRRFNCGRSIPFTASALVEAVTSLLLNVQEYEQLRSNGIEHSKDFDWDLVFKKEYELISSHYSALSG